VKSFPRQPSLWGSVVELTGYDVNMEVRHDIAQQQVVPMTGAEDAFDHQFTVWMSCE
jgi:hypothetical protein